MEKLAYNYPAWHDSSYRGGFNEWELILKQKSRFYGHIIQQPKIIYDDTDPVEILAQIKLAESIGLNGFVMCYYFDGENEAFNEGIDLGLLPAVKNTNFVFSLLVSPRLPRKKLPLPLTENDSDERKNRKISFGKKELYNLFHNVLSKYSLLNNFYKINGNPVIFLFQYYSFFDDNNITEIDILNIKKEVAKNYGFSGIFLVGTVDYINQVKYVSYIDMYTSYNNLPDYNNGTSIQNYQELVNNQIYKWSNYSNILDNKYSPSISLGFDSSSRGEYTKKIPKKLEGGRYYPWYPMVNNFDIQSLEFLIIEAYKISIKNKTNFVMYCAWNERSEGCIILEDTFFGTQKLDIIKKVNNTFSNHQF